MKFYNEDAILTKVANELRIDENVLRNYDEKLLSFIFDDFTQMDGSTLDANVYAPMRIYQAMSSVILKTIEEGPCILMEGCADQILRGKVDFLHVFIYTPDTKAKIERTVNLGGILEKDALKHIFIQDNQRGFYHNIFSDSEWGKMKEYDLCLNSSAFEIEQCIEIIKSAL